MILGAYCCGISQESGQLRHVIEWYGGLGACMWGLMATSTSGPSWCSQPLQSLLDQQVKFGRQHFAGNKLCQESQDSLHSVESEAGRGGPMHSRALLTAPMCLRPAGDSRRVLSCQQENRFEWGSSEEIGHVQGLLPGWYKGLSGGPQCSLGVLHPLLTAARCLRLAVASLPLPAHLAGMGAARGLDQLRGCSICHTAASLCQLSHNEPTHADNTWTRCSKASLAQACLSVHASGARSEGWRIAGRAATMRRMLSAWAQMLVQSSRLRLGKTSSTGCHSEATLLPCQLFPLPARRALILHHCHTFVQMCHARLPAVFYQIPRLKAAGSGRAL